MRHMKQHFKTAVTVTLVLFSVAVAVTMILVSSSRPLSTLETILFQMLIWLTGLYGSFRFGRSSEMKSARESIRLHARPAFRRALELYYRLYDLSNEIESLKRKGADHRLDIIQAIVNEQIRTGNSTIEDWRDIIPDDVDDVATRLNKNQTQMKDIKNGNSN